MTAPKFTDNISLGNIIQVAVLLVAVSASFLFVQFQSAATAEEAKKVVVEMNKLELRVRSLEVHEATGTERLQSVQRDVREIKQGLNENNSILRQLLRQNTGGNND